MSKHSQISSILFLNLISLYLRYTIYWRIYFFVRFFSVSSCVIYAKVSSWFKFPRSFKIYLVCHINNKFMSFGRFTAFSVHKYGFSKLMKFFLYWFKKIIKYFLVILFDLYRKLRIFLTSFDSFNFFHF